MTPPVFLAVDSAVWTVGVLALLAAGVLAALEWRRADRRRLGWRVGATLLAVGALALLALRPAWRGRAPEGAAAAENGATLWTARADGGQAAAIPEKNIGGRRFALPDAAVPGSVGATVLPDAAALRRRFPDIGQLRIVGDGLEEFDLAALAGMRVDFQPAPRAAAAGAAIIFLRCPRVLTPGEPLTVEGRVGGLAAGGTAALTLASPDGDTTETVTPAADGDGEAGFALAAAPPPAAGRFVWRLRLGTPGENGRVPADETLGVAVVAPALPRVLVLESAPRFDTALLRRWYAGAGGTLRARVRLGQDRYRFFSAGGAPGEWNALDAGLLAGFDLVLADARALASLPPAERAALRTAVADTGLGVLALADDALLPPAAVAPDRAWLFPWLLRPVGNGGGDDGTGPPIPADAPAAANNGAETLARIRWAGQAKPVEAPLPAAPFEIAAQPGQTSVARDGQGRTLAAVATLGRGRLALTLVRETGRWQRGGDAGAFAGYWSEMLSQVARPRGEGPWQLAGGDGGPVFVDQPAEFVRSGPADGPPPAGVRVTDGAGAGAVTLAPAGEPGAPGRWRVDFWPRRAGWHRLEEKNGGAGLDFYVSPAGTWSGLAAARRRGATARFAARSAGVVAHGRTPPRGTEEKPVPAGWWWGAFILGAGFLWVERRNAEPGTRNPQQQQTEPAPRNAG